MRPRPDPIAPGQESVWSYPRPPVVEPTKLRLLIVHRGLTIANTVRGLRLLETSHPPTYYFPLADITQGCLTPADGSSFCEWKGVARYFDVVAGEARLPNVAWTYPSPTPRFAALAGHVAFYATPFDACYVGEEAARPQPGGFYGGWVTSLEAGPFKGVPGSGGW